MPAHAGLDDEELALVVLYERVQFGGLEEGAEEYELLLEIAEGETTFADAGPRRALRRRRHHRGRPSPPAEPPAIAGRLGRTGRLSA